MKTKETGNEAAAIVAVARDILSEMSVETVDTDGSPLWQPPPPANYNWFGCETDDELLREIPLIANGEGYTSDALLDERTLRHVLGVMYHS